VGLPPDFLRMVLGRVGWEDAACASIRATCSTWSSIFDAWCPWLQHWTAVMEGKMGWFPSVAWVNLLGCEEVADISSNLTELRSMPSLHTLTLPASCTEREVDAGALYGLSTLTELRFCEMREYDDEGELVEEAGEWALDLSRLTSLSSLALEDCPTLKDEQMEAASKLTGLTEINLGGCRNVTTEGLRAIKTLTSLSMLHLRFCTNVATDRYMKATDSSSGPQTNTPASHTQQQQQKQAALPWRRKGCAQ